MDFEQALKNEGTMRLKEGIDVNQLGLFDTSGESGVSSAFTSPASSPPGGNKGYASGTVRQLPSTPSYGARKTVAGGVGLATPTIVPPTPDHSRTNANNTSSSTSVATVGNGAKIQPQGSPSSSSHELFYDADDGASGGTNASSANGSANNLSTSTATPMHANPNTSNLTPSNVNTNRRSIYRSPGTSSSPDLATLLRKAKEKGDPVSIQKLKKEFPHSSKMKEAVPPLPERESRPRSSTTSAGSPRSTPNSPAMAKSMGRGESSFGGRSGKEHGTKVRFSNLIDWRFISRHSIVEIVCS